MSAFSHYIPFLWHTSSHEKCMGFLIKFPIVLGKSVKPIEWERPGKLVPILVPYNGRFFPLDFHHVVYFII